MKYTALLASLVLLGGAAAAQTGTIAGTVTSENGTPIEGAAVRVTGTSYGVMTKANGRYAILGVPPGTYIVSAARIGMTPVEVRNVVVIIDVTRSLDIQMASSSASEQSLAQAPLRSAASDDPFSRCLFPPELISTHWQDIGLQDSQRKAILGEVLIAQSKFTEAQWNLSAEQRKLEQILKETKIDEGAASQQLAKILSIEETIKRSQLTLLVRTKNLLTAQQQDALNVIRGGPERRARAADGSILPACGT